MTKSERRLKRVNQIAAVAQEMSTDFDPADKMSVRDLLITLTSEMDLDPSVDRSNGSVRAIAVDANGYRTFPVMIPYTQKQMLSEAYKLCLIYTEGGPKNPGDLSLIKISAVARKILEHAVGPKWRSLLSGMVSDYYAGHGRADRNYARINDQIAFKISGGVIMVRAAMGQAKYQNGHLVIQNMPLPKTMTVGMAGKPVDEIVEGDHYGQVLVGETILMAESPDSTLVIQIAETLEPAGEPE